VQQKLSLEGGGGELVPWHQEDGPAFADDAFAGNPCESQQVVVGRQPQLESRRPQT
jgi:hypothetical protein